MNWVHFIQNARLYAQIQRIGTDKTNRTDNQGGNVETWILTFIIHMMFTCQSICFSLTEWLQRWATPELTPLATKNFWYNSIATVGVRGCPNLVRLCMKL